MAQQPATKEQKESKRRARWFYLPLAGTVVAAALAAALGLKAVLAALLLPSTLILMYVPYLGPSAIACMFPAEGARPLGVALAAALALAQFSLELQPLAAWERHRQRQMLLALTAVLLAHAAAVIAGQLRWF
jgi:hypothetical protein